MPVRKTIEMDPVRRELREDAPVHVPRERRTTPCKTDLPETEAIAFAEDTAIAVESLSARFDEIASRLLRALTENPSISIRVTAVRETAALSPNRLQSVAQALIRRGVPPALIQTRLLEGQASEPSTHDRAQVWIETFVRRVGDAGTR